MQAADKSRTQGTEIVPTAVPNPPQAGGVKIMPEIGKERPTRNVGIVARKATRRTCGLVVVDVMEKTAPRRNQGNMRKNWPLRVGTLFNNLYILRSNSVDVKILGSTHLLFRKS